MKIARLFKRMIVLPGSCAGRQIFQTINFVNWPIFFLKTIAGPFKIYPGQSVISPGEKPWGLWDRTSFAPPPPPPPLTDCANPNIDFAGGLVVANHATAEQLNIPEHERVNVAGSGYAVVKGAPDAIDRICGDGNELFAHLKDAFLSAQAEARIDLIREFESKNLLLEAYTCYPPIPIALLLVTGLIGNINALDGFLRDNEITVTGGMNIARAPWNNPALNALIEMTQRLGQGHYQYGLVHGNGGIGEAQGITILERSFPPL